MKNKLLFEKAYSRLLELYSGEYTTPDITVLSRFYREKMILGQNELYMRSLDFLSRVRETANKKGEHVFVRGTTGASFIAFLLGATDINPLPRHEYCPHCHTTKFGGSGTPFDNAPIKCSCGAFLVTDGHNLPFEADLKNALSERLSLCVSRAFFDEAKAMLFDAMWDKTIVTLTDEGASPVWFCFLDKKTNECGTYSLSGNREAFSLLPRITLVPEKTLDKYRELEKATGFKIKDIGPDEQSLAFFQFIKRNIQSIPHFDNDFVKGIWDTINPQNYDDLLKIIGFAHSTNVWKNNAEILIGKRRISIQEIPPFREDLYEMIRERLYKKGVCDEGLAYEVADKAMRGYYAKNGGVDEETALTLMDLGFNIDFISFLSDINYMFTKAHGISFLREAVAMMFYKTNFNKEYNEIMLEKNSRADGND